MSEKDELAEIEQWLEGLGYGLVYTKDHGGPTWANLARSPGGRVGAPRYERAIRGSRPRSAKHRHEVEE